MSVNDSALETAETIIRRQFPDAQVQERGRMFYIIQLGKPGDLGFGTTEDKAWELAADRMGHKHRKVVK